MYSTLLPSDNPWFYILVNLDIICTLNSLFIIDVMSTSLFHWLYSTWNNPRFICFLYIACVFHIGTYSYRAGIIMNACKCSLAKRGYLHYHIYSAAVPSNGGRIFWCTYYNWFVIYVVMSCRSPSCHLYVWFVVIRLCCNW